MTANRVSALLVTLCATPAPAACGGAEAGRADAPEDVPADPADGTPDVAADDGAPEGEAPASDAREDAGDEGTDAACGPRTDPLRLWIDRGEIDLVGSGPVSLGGRIAASCAVDGFRLVAARGMRVRVEVDMEAASGLDGRVALHPAGAVSGGSPGALVEAVGAPGFTAILEAAIAASGEHLLLVHDLQLRDPGAYGLRAWCVSGCGSRATRFPIVLLHGFGGWGTILGFLDYFHGVKADLEGAGYDVRTPVADASNESAVRARQFAEQIDAILRETGARKVNLVAHSQGGIDARVLISAMGYGDRVGALVMVSTPNRGTIVADALTGDLPVTEAILSGLLDLWSGLLGWSEADTRAAFRQIATRRMTEEFNPAHPDDPRVAYWSHAGRTCATIDLACRRANSGEVVDPVLRITFGLLDGDGPGQGPNDGLVTVESAAWGAFRGTLPADHWDEIGQLADGGPAGPFDHVAFYRQVAADLHRAGL